MVQICRELKRVLKKTGTFWLNMGDTYYGSGKGVWEGHEDESKEIYQMPRNSIPKQKAIGNWLQPKQKLLMPARLAVALQDDGWILRNEIVWHKPNHMPSSVKDRLTNAWESVFLFSKARKYWFDLDAIRKPHTTNLPQRSQGVFHDHIDDLGRGQRIQEKINNPRGKNPGDVWRIPTYPFPEAHFATFPPKLIKPMILAGCPRQICPKCGVARTRQTKTRYETDGRKRRPVAKGGKTEQRQKEFGAFHYGSVLNIIKETVGWSDCGCNVGFRSGIVLDPFVGSGTVPMMAQKLARAWIGIDLKPEYCDMARNRIMKECSQKLVKWIPNA